MIDNILFVYLAQLIYSSFIRLTRYFRIMFNKNYIIAMIDYNWNGKKLQKIISPSFAMLSTVFIITSWLNFNVNHNISSLILNHKCCLVDDKKLHWYGFARYVTIYTYR